MSDHILKKNLSLLARKNPELAQRLYEQIAPYEVYKTRSGHVGVKVSDQAGTEVPLHSMYNPLREATQIVDSYTVTKTADVIFLGFGLGYHVLELCKREGHRGLILVCERDPRFVRTAFEHIDFSHALEHLELIFSVGESSIQLFNRIKDYSLSFLTNGLTVLNHPASMRLYGVYYESVRSVISEAFTWAQVNLNTQLAKAETFANNIFANMLEFTSSPGIGELFGMYHGIPAFIVSAGPSLIKNVDYLHEVGNKGIILCVDSAARTLYDVGVRPDLVVSIDFGAHNKKYIQAIQDEDFVLTFDPEVFPEIVQQHKGKKFAINLPGKALCDWYAQAVEDKGSIDKGLSVSHTALLIAEALGCTPIVFLGQDLSYPHGDWHVKGSLQYQKARIHGVMQKRFVNVPGYFGGSVESEVSLQVFINHFESIVSEIDIPIYNATEGGAHINGMKQISLREAINAFCKKEASKASIWEKAAGKDTEVTMARLFSAAARTMKNLTLCNHASYEAYQALVRMAEEINKPQCNRDLVMREYNLVSKVIKKFSENEDIINVIRDNALEAVIIRQRREQFAITHANFDNPKDLLTLVKKEQVFFQSFIRATDFLSKKFCTLLNTIKSSYPSISEQCVV